MSSESKVKIFYFLKPPFSSSKWKCLTIHSLTTLLPCFFWKIFHTFFMNYFILRTKPQGEGSLTYTFPGGGRGNWRIRIMFFQSPGGVPPGEAVDMCIKQGDDYMESSQPGLNFSPVNRAEIFSRLHEFKFQLKPRMKSQPRAEQSSLKIELFCFCEEFKVLFTVNDRLNAAHWISAALK
jgi:hypothetical protein